MPIAVNLENPLFAPVIIVQNFAIVTAYHRVTLPQRHPLFLDYFLRLYLLEDIDDNGISTFHTPVKAVPRWWK
jgi:hypothetical protein